MPQETKFLLATVAPAPHTKATRTWNDRRMVCPVHPLWKPLGVKIRNMRRQGSAPSTRASNRHLSRRAPERMPRQATGGELRIRHSGTPRTSSLYGLTHGIYTIHRAQGARGRRWGTSERHRQRNGRRDRDNPLPRMEDRCHRPQQIPPTTRPTRMPPPGAWCSSSEGEIACPKHPWKSTEGQDTQPIKKHNAQNKQHTQTQEQQRRRAKSPSPYGATYQKHRHCSLALSP